MLSFGPTARLTLRTDPLFVGDRLLCLRPGNCQYGKYLCLVLKRRGGDKKFPVHERIGYFSYKAKELEKHWFTPGIENARTKIV
jgi:hypothetical protein